MATPANTRAAQYRAAKDALPELPAAELPREAGQPRLALAVQADGGLKITAGPSEVMLSEAEVLIGLGFLNTWYTDAG